MKPASEMVGAETITVLYSCPLCAITDQEVPVRLRRPDEDVVSWMDHVVMSTARDHAKRSPDCSPSQLHDLKIPMPPGSQMIGGPVQQ